MNRSKDDMPFWDHLEELRWRIIKSLLAIIIGAIITYHYGDIVIFWLVSPSQSLSIDLNLQVLKVTSMFTIKITVALFGGIFIGLPIILYQLWRFISPAFEEDYGSSVFLTILLSTLFLLK